MAEINENPWEPFNVRLALYRFASAAETENLASAPILMLHGPMMTHRTWDMLASYLRAKGAAHIYAVDIAEMMITHPLHQETQDYLNEVVAWILQQYPEDTRLVMIAHSTGGVMARRFLFKSGLASQVIYLFSLGSPHYRTRFTHSIYVPPEDDYNFVKPTPGTTKTLREPHIPPETNIINFLGNALGPNFDGTVRGVFLPEAVNVVLPIRHMQFKQHESVFSEILAYLRGHRFRVQLHLAKVLMQEADFEDMVGPFCFEINGMRSPFDGVFQAQVNYTYNYEVYHTPLASLPFTDDVALVSVIFQLKDLNRHSAIRRRLFAKMMVALTDQSLALHEVQDNLGSTIGVHVTAERMPRILNNYDT